jgi:hypothetical protein
MLLAILQVNRLLKEQVQTHKHNLYLIKHLLQFLKACLLERLPSVHAAAFKLLLWESKPQCGSHSVGPSEKGGEPASQGLLTAQLHHKYCLLVS